MRKFWRGFGLVLIVVGIIWVVSVVGGSVYGAIKTRHIGGWLEQAKVAGSAEQMADYTQNVLSEMEKLGMTQGYSVIWLHQASNNMGVHYQVLTDIQQRAKYVSESSALNTIQQSQALSDLRINLGNLELEVVLWYVLHNGALVLCYMAWLPIAFLMILAGYFLVE